VDCLKFYEYLTSKRRIVYRSCDDDDDDREHNDDDDDDITCVSAAFSVSAAIEYSQFAFILFRLYDDVCLSVVPLAEEKRNVRRLFTTCFYPMPTFASPSLAIRLSASVWPGQLYTLSRKKIPKCFL